MPDLASPLGTGQRTGRFGATFDAGPGVILSQAPIEHLLQIAGWDGFEAAVLPALKKLGFSDLGTYQTARQHKGMWLFRIAPDRLLIAGQLAEKLPGDLLDTPDLAVLDLGHARAKITVEGPAAENLMAHLAAVNFRQSALPAGDFVQTGIHHVGVLIRRSAEARFDIFVPASFARSIWELVCLNATPYGYDVAPAS